MGAFRMSALFISLPHPSYSDMMVEPTSMPVRSHIVKSTHTHIPQNEDEYYVLYSVYSDIFTF
uniref:Uncharacterized protein n=1 Tax=Arion vulgaris TaxID=1028688 RepID=A0A0B7AKJ4_9EUPU